MEALYAAFAPRQVARKGRPGVDYCDHCVDPVDDATLRTTAVRDLPADLVASFLISSGTWGGIPELRRALPRALEAQAAGELWTDPGLTARSIGRAAPEGFTDAERDAVQAWVDAWWSHLATDPDVDETDAAEVLDALTRSGFPPHRS